MSVPSSRAEAESEPVLETPRVEPDPDPAEMLADDHAQHFPKRAQLATIERARFRPDGAELVREEPREPYPQETPSVVVDQRSPLVRIVSEAHHLRVLAWVHQDQLRTVVVERARLQPTSGADAVVAHPGLALSVKERTRERVRIAYDADGVRFDGWIAASALGTVYVPAPWTPATSDSSLPAGTVIQRRDGSTLATFSEEQPVQRLGDPDAGRQRVSFRRAVESRVPGSLGAFEIQGWVLVAKLSKGGMALGSISSSGGGEGWGGSHVQKLPKATRVFDAPQGSWIGITLNEAIGRAGEVERGWTAFEMKTLWDFTTFWLAPGAAPAR